MYLYKRGPGAKRRVMHLAMHNPLTGDPLAKPLCGDTRVAFDTTCNLPLARPVCKACRRAWATASGTHADE